MEKCPRCGHWTLSFNLIQKNAFCYNCNYEEKIDDKKYREKNDLMPKLLKSLGDKTMRVLNRDGTLKEVRTHNATITNRVAMKPTVFSRG